MELQFLFGNPIIHNGKKIEPTTKLNHNIYMSVPSRLPFGRAMRAFTSGLKGESLNHHIVAMGSSSEPLYLGNPVTSTDKLLGHVYFMGKVSRFSSHNYIQHVT